MKKLNKIGFVVAVSFFAQLAAVAEQIAIDPEDIGRVLTFCQYGKQSLSEQIPHSRWQLKWVWQEGQLQLVDCQTEAVLQQAERDGQDRAFFDSDLLLATLNPGFGSIESVLIKDKLHFTAASDNHLQSFVIEPEGPCNQSVFDPDLPACYASKIASHLIPFKKAIGVSTKMLRDFENEGNVPAYDVKALAFSNYLAKSAYSLSNRHNLVLEAIDGYFAEMEDSDVHLQNTLATLLRRVRNQDCYPEDFCDLYHYYLDLLDSISSSSDLAGQYLSWFFDEDSFLRGSVLEKLAAPLSVKLLSPRFERVPTNYLARISRMRFKACETYLASQDAKTDELVSLLPPLFSKPSTVLNRQAEILLLSFLVSSPARTAADKWEAIKHELSRASQNQEPTDADELEMHFAYLNKLLSEVSL